MAETSRESAVIDHADADKRIIMNLPEIMILSRRLETTSKEYVETTKKLPSKRSSVLPMEEYFLRARSKLPEILKMLLEVLGEISNEPLKSLQEPVQSSEKPVQSLKELLDYLVCFMEQETSLYKELLEYSWWLLEHMMEDLVDEVHEKLRILQQRVQESQDIAEARLKDIPVKGLRQKFEDPDNQIKVDEINEKLRIVQQRVQTIHDSLEKIVIKEIATARSSALKFMSAYPCCVRVVPYVNEIKEGQEKYLKMRVYIHTGGDEIPKDVKKAAEEMFTDYEIDYCDLQRLPLNKIVTQLPSSEKKREKELSKLSKIIEENLHVFENKLNVTAVQASYKVTGAKEKDELCVTVFVLGKGQIPAGETSFKKIEKLHNYPYDIAEGYYQPACLPVLGSYAHQLHSGVGIGVKDDEGAGTLGGFLTDENGKYYILSCEHVLHPPRMKNEEEDYAIVQPAESDYYKKIEEAEESLANLSQIEFTQEELDAMDAEERQYWETKEKNYKSKVDDLERIRSEKPRQIATYKCGVKDNVEVNLGESKVKVFVDAAIAELDDRERRFIERNSKVNRLCGFTEQYFKNSPNGEIVEVADFETERRKEETEHKKKLTFMKVGRTTGLQVSGEIYCDHNPMYINIQPADSPLSDFRSFNCDNCPQTDSSEEETFKKDNNTLTSCASWDVTFKSGDKITSFWIRNCLAIRQRKIPFCDKGDSGALVFDSNGRAWGQVVGVFEDLSRDFLFCQASPLSVTLKALESKSGKELKLWSTNKK